VSPLKKQATTQQTNSKGEWSKVEMTTWGGLKGRYSGFVGIGFSLLTGSTFVSRENDSSKKHEHANSY